MCASYLSPQLAWQQEEEAPAVAANPAVSNSHVMNMLSAMLRSSYDVRPCSFVPCLPVPAA